MENEKNNFGRPLKYKSVTELQEKIDEYFESRKPEIINDINGHPMRDKNGHPIYELNPPTITGLALHLGFCSRQSFYNYEAKKDFLDTIKKARLRCEQYVENALMSNKVAPASGIFILKNYNWTDKQDVEINDISDREINININGV